MDANFAQNGHKDSEIQNGQLKVHEGKKPSKCKICDAKFAQNGQLKVRFMKERHLSNARFVTLISY